MAELLAELDPSAYVLDCLWNMSAELVSERVEPFVKTLRRPSGHAHRAGRRLQRRQRLSNGEKAHLRKIHQILTAEGVKNLHFLSNAGMLGDDAEGTVDGCHPNDLGMQRQACSPRRYRRCWRTEMTFHPWEHLLHTPLQIFNSVQFVLKSNGTKERQIKTKLEHRLLFLQNRFIQ